MAEKINLDVKHSIGDIANVISAYQSKIDSIIEKINDRSIEGSEYLDFLDLQNEGTADLKEINKTAKKIQNDCEVLLVIAPYSISIQTKAVLDFMYGLNYKNLHQEMEIIFVDHFLSGREIQSVTEYLETKNFAIHAISKSGDDLDVISNLKIFTSFLEQKLGSKTAAKYIYITTDANNGYLMELARDNLYIQFVFPDQIHEAYSLLTSASLLSLSCAGVDINKIVSGAKKGFELYTKNKLRDNTAYLYAVVRNALELHKMNHEIFVVNEESLSNISNYWKFLFSQSTTNNQNALILDIATYPKEISTKLQYIQTNIKNAFQTFLSIEQRDIDFQAVSSYNEDEEQLMISSLTQNKLLEFSSAALIKTNFELGKIRYNHITLADDKEDTVGYLISFLQNASVMSAYLNKQNPFTSDTYNIFKIQLLNKIKEVNK
ncbi:hypothetical protein [Mycoplasma phocoenae]|uniref:Glucose-6-phosphate isomerase n=1 Tax=Mycoplasma phocoenae TaxID=754517 RepID=A0A858U3Z2_9MOLU|nr:hypothetical protein [Mycoplasma phocoenae]QJG66779.1 hypothetical protein HGG69_00320 [Mycoplasma phocoenae]